MLHSRNDRGKGEEAVDVLRCTIIDARGGVSFVAHADVLPALAKACTDNPPTLEQLLDGATRYYGGLREQVLNGLAMFDERNVEGHYESIHQALDLCAPYEQPVFRVVDDRTREASLCPVKAGAVVFNLRARRIIQIENTYREITRRGVGRVFDGTRMTNQVFSYQLPGEWALVP
jgi:hypothetical protein